MVHLCPYVATSIKMNVIKIFLFLMENDKRFQNIICMCTNSPILFYLEINSCSCPKKKQGDQFMFISQDFIAPCPY